VRVLRRVAEGFLTPYWNIFWNGFKSFIVARAKAFGPATMHPAQEALLQRRVLIDALDQNLNFWATLPKNFINIPR
jgi:hypothetical protein